MHRSRSHLLVLISSLSLIFTLGAATVVPPTASNARQRQTRRHRIGNPRVPHLIRELDRHLAAGSKDPIGSFDREASSALPGAGEGTGAVKATALVSSVAAFTPSYNAVPLPIGFDEPSGLQRPLTAIRGRAPPVSLV